MSRSRLFAALSLAVCAFATARADNWPAWRGPTGQGTTAETKLPLKWSAKENVKWKIDLPDAGNSTPIVWGDFVFLTQAADKGKTRSLWCLNRKDGTKVWDKSVAFTGKEQIHGTNTYCAASPVTDGERVIAFHGSAGLHCYDMKGNVKWSKDLGPCDHIWGSAASPVIHNDLVILNFGPHARSFVVAFKKSDGAEVWRTEEYKGSDYFGTWSTPVIANTGKRTEMVMSWPGVVKGHDLETGKVLWSSKGLEKEGGQDRLTYASPLVSEKYVFAAAGYGGAAVAVKTGGAGDVTDTHRLWRASKNPQRIGSGVIVGDFAYVVNEPSVVCIDLRTGKQTWEEKVGTAWGSIVRANDRLYLTTQNAETRVFAAKPDAYEELARNKLDGATTRASIVPSNGDLFVRTYKHLWCIGEKK
jgi:hypothetical protein